MWGILVRQIVRYLVFFFRLGPMANPNTAYRTTGQKPVQPVPPATIQQMRPVQPSHADPPQKPRYMVRPPGGKNGFGVKGNVHQLRTERKCF